MKLRIYADVKVHINTEDIPKENVVYCLIFPNDKKYIGQTKNSLDLRLKHHSNSSFNIKSTDFNTKKARAIRKYLTFKVEILYQGDDINNKEQEFIKLYNTYEDGYNSDLGGIGGLTNDNRISVEQIGNKGEIINTFNSYLDAAKFIKPDKVSSAVSAICAVANGKRKTAYGFIWVIKNK